jgi:hypothetical protein
MIRQQSEELDERAYEGPREESREVAGVQLLEANALRAALRVCREREPAYPENWGDPSKAISVVDGYEWAPHDWACVDGVWSCRRCRLVGEYSLGRLYIDPPYPGTCPLDVAYWDASRASASARRASEKGESCH